MTSAPPRPGPPPWRLAASQAPSASSAPCLRVLDRGRRPGDSLTISRPGSGREKGVTLLPQRADFVPTLLPTDCPCPVRRSTQCPSLCRAVHGHILRAWAYAAQPSLPGTSRAFALKVTVGGLKGFALVLSLASELPLSSLGCKDLCKTGPVLWLVPPKRHCLAFLLGKGPSSPILGWGPLGRLQAPKPALPSDWLQRPSPLPQSLLVKPVEPGSC